MLNQGGHMSGKPKFWFFFFTSEKNVQNKNINNKNV